MAFTVFGLLAACGGGGGGGGGDDGVDVDAPPAAPAMITISGVATKRMGVNQSNADGAVVAAYKNSDPNTPIAMTTTDAAGMYTLTLETGGVALEGYIKATLAGYLDLYLYPPKPLTEDYAGASLNIVNQDSLNLMYLICKPNPPDDAKGTIAVIVADAAKASIAGATVSSNPAAANDCYNGTNSLPDMNVNNTAADGIAYLIAVPAGDVTVVASAGGTAFGSHKVNARAGALTTTVIQQ